MQDADRPPHTQLRCLFGWATIHAQPHDAARAAVCRAVAFGSWCIVGGSYQRGDSATTLVIRAGEAKPGGVDSASDDGTIARGGGDAEGAERQGAQTALASQGGV